MARGSGLGRYCRENRNVEFGFGRDDADSFIFSDVGRGGRHQDAARLCGKNGGGTLRLSPRRSGEFCADDAGIGTYSCVDGALL